MRLLTNITKDVDKTMNETIKEPQHPKHERGLDVTLQVTQCAGCVLGLISLGDSRSVGAT